MSYSQDNHHPMIVERSETYAQRQAVNERNTSSSYDGVLQNSEKHQNYHHYDNLLAPVDCCTTNISFEEHDNGSCLLNQSSPTPQQHTTPRYRKRPLSALEESYWGADNSPSIASITLARNIDLAVSNEYAHKKMELDSNPSVEARLNNLEGIPESTGRTDLGVSLQDRTLSVRINLKPLLWIDLGTVCPSLETSINVTDRRSSGSLSRVSPERRAGKQKVFKFKPHVFKDKQRKVLSASGVKDTVSSEESEGLWTGPWSAQEHELFLKGLKERGRSWKVISKDYVRTRNRVQVSSHAQKFFRRMHELGQVVEEASVEPISK